MQVTTNQLTCKQNAQQHSAFLTKNVWYVAESFSSHP